MKPINRSEQKIFGIKIFTWESWDEIDVGFLKFCNVDFPYESMKKYNGSDVSLDMNGEMIITSDDGEGEELWRGFAIEIPEFFEAIFREDI